MNVAWISLHYFDLNLLIYGVGKDFNGKENAKIGFEIF